MQRSISTNYDYDTNKRNNQFESQILIWNRDNFISLKNCICFDNLITKTKFLSTIQTSILFYQVELEKKKIRGEREIFIFMSVFDKMYVN